MNPQTGEQTSRWDCVDNLLPMLLVENTQQQRHTCASVDRLRHEAEQRSDVQREALLGAAGALGEIAGATPLKIEYQS
jgi:hypothetical protein